MSPVAFAFVDDQGHPTGGGIDFDVPKGAVVLPDTFTTLDLPRLRYRDGSWEWRPAPEPAPAPSAEERAAWAAEALAQARAHAVAMVNEAAGTLRASVYTDITGQDALYLEKRAEAEAYVRAARQSGETAVLDEYPLLQGEVGITAPTAWQLAQIWLFRAHQFKRLGGATERLRMEASAAIAVAPDALAVEAAQNAFVQAIQALQT